MVDISEQTSIAMGIGSEQGSSVSGEQREEMMLSRNVGEAAKKFRNLCSGVRGLVETVMGLESKRGKETLGERNRYKCGDFGVEKSEIAALAFGRALLYGVGCVCVS